ncbi:MAG: hypothetical protein KGQ80_06545, partial [Bacteroidetes bacterium]|nr:hypothetical protein [Bacteroidota bacterium]
MTYLIQCFVDDRGHKNGVGMFAFFVFLLCHFSSGAQINISNTTAVTQNFDGLGTSGSASLPSGWKMSAAGAGTTAEYSTTGNLTAVSQAASSGIPATGGRYNWGSSSSERCIGFMTSTGYASPNSIMVAFKNVTGSQITGFTISFTYKRFRINSAAASVSFSTSTNGSTWTTDTSGQSGAYSTGSSAYGFPRDSINKSFTISSLSLNPDSLFYLKWNFNTTGSNSQGIGIDNFSITATTQPATTPTVTTTAASSITSTSASSGGNVTSDGGASVSARGVAYATTASPTTSNSTTSNGSGTGVFTSSLTGLTSSTLYYLRAYATNSVGTSYGSEISFTTEAPSPEIVLNSSSFNSDFGIVLIGSSSSYSSYTVSGNNLTADITIVPPAGFGIRTGSNAFSSSNIVLSPIGGSVAATTIDVRFTPSAEGLVNQNIQHFSSGAANVLRSVSGRCPQSYIWNQTGSASASTSSNWTPARSNAHSSDRLIINNGASTTLTSFNSTDLRALMLSNNSTVVLQASSAATINVSDSLIVDSGSTLIVDGTTAITLTMGSVSSKALISGTMSFSGGVAHKLTSILANGIEFLNGSTFIAQSLSGNPFGNATSGSVVFRNGSSYVFRSGSNPFAITNGVCSFESTSNFVVK